MLGVLLVVICVITKGKLKLVFDLDKYMRDLQDFLIGQMSDPEVREELNEIYKQHYVMAWHGDGPGDILWHNFVFEAIEKWGKLAKVQPRLGADGRVTMTIGIPPPGEDYWGKEDYPDRPMKKNKEGTLHGKSGFRYYQFVMEYGVGSAGIGHGNAQSGKPLRYHNVGEETWSPAFDYTSEVTKAPRAGQLLPGPMNQPGMHQFESIRKEVYAVFRKHAVTWFGMFKDICPFGDYIKFK